MPARRPLPLVLAPLVVLAAVAPVPACGGGGAAPRVPESAPLHLILFTVDTHRGDHVFADRAGEPLTPELARFAAGRAVRFDEAYSVSDCTSPGTAAILTGLLPHRSGVFLNSHLVPEGVPTLATVLREAGFRTAAFVSTPVLRPGMGFERGFETYERLKGEHLPGGGGVRVKPAAERIARAGLDWWDAQDGDERLFLWVHFMEPHGPYDPPDELRELFPREAFDAPSDVRLLESNTGRGGIPAYQQVSAAPGDEADARDYLARYAAEVRSLDRSLGALLGELEERGALDDAVLVLTSDHGEALAGENGRWFSHDHGVTRDQVHVPLVLAWPGAPAGEVVRRPVSTVDVAPTVLELLGVEPPAELDGGSLLDEAPRPVVSHTGEGVAIREGRWVLRLVPGGEAALFDVERDPDEGEDVAALHPDVVEKLRRHARGIQARPPLAAPELRPRGR